MLETSPVKYVVRKGLLQIISKSYARVRHYSHLDPNSKKPQFLYHKQTLQYIERILSLKQVNGQDFDHKNHDLKKPNSAFKIWNSGAPSGI